MTRNRDAGQRASDVMALGLTSGLAAMLLLAGRPIWIAQAHPPAAALNGIELSVESAPTPAPPAPPPPLPRRVIAHHTFTPQVLADSVALPASDQQTAPEDAPLVASSDAAPAQQASDTHPDIDAQYAAQLRADIDRRTRPPDTAQYRLHHPSGAVQVRFVVMRSGLQRSSTLVRSSGSAILDEAAVRIVAAGHYAPMPASAFVGEPEHAFLVTIEFRSGDPILGAR